MQTPKRSSDFWFPIIEDFVYSGMTQDQFAEAHDINVAFPLSCGYANPPTKIR